jgi:hypothetical protein
VTAYQFTWVRDRFACMTRRGRIFRKSPRSSLSFSHFTWKRNSETEDPVPHSARRVSVGSVRSARSTAGSVATRAMSPRAHAGTAIMSASVAFTW